MSLVTLFFPDDVRLFFDLVQKKLKREKNLTLSYKCEYYFLGEFCTIYVAANFTNVTHVLAVFLQGIQ